MKELVVNKKDNNKKIVSVLIQNFNGLHSSTVYKALRNKDIKVNNKRVHDNITVFEGDIICIYIKDSLLFLSYSIIYEDINILIVNKPKGIEVISETSPNCLKSVLENDLKCQLLPCHRLDLNTSGLVIFAKNSEALNILKEKFKNNEISKFYLCDVIGILEKKEATIEAYLFKDSKKSISFISNKIKPGYKKIITSYKVINEDYRKNISTLEVELHTGKTHQIRAHLSYIGHPIIGDGKYGINDINKKFNKKSQELLAYKLIFNFKSESGILNYLNNKTFTV